MDIYEGIRSRLAEQRSHHLWRSRRPLSLEHGNHVRLADGSSLLNFASNDYLGLSQAPEIIETLQQQALKLGFGSGSSPLICGYSQEHQRLEEQFANFVERERAIFFGSGFLANIGLIKALTDQHTDILMDRLAHASLIDGSQLSGQRFRRFRHNDAQHLEQLLKHQVNRPTLVLTESIYSMDGDIAHLQEIASLCRAPSSENPDHSQATLLVDDAHGFGIIGANGRGALSHFGLSERDVPLLVTPFGKAMGSYGAMVSGPAFLIEALEQFARSYIYSTALPALHARASLTALNLIATDQWRRDQLFTNIHHANREIERLGLELVSQDLTPIRALLFRENQHTLNIRDRVLDRGFLVSAIRPPTVPNGTARIRFSLNALHTPAEISAVLEAIAEADHELKRHD